MYPYFINIKIFVYKLICEIFSWPFHCVFNENIVKMQIQIARIHSNV